jgi:hypothetical protein
MGKNALTQSHPASCSAQLDDVIPTMSLDHLELRELRKIYTLKDQQLTECQFWYVQGRFRR